MAVTTGCAPLVAVTLSATGVILSLSRSAEEWTGCLATDAVGRPLGLIAAGCSASMMDEMMEAAEKNGVWKGALSLRNRSGAAVEVDAGLWPLAGAEHTVFLLIATVSPGPEETVEDGSAPNEVAGRLRAIAHALNNPLAVLMGFIQLMLLNEHCRGSLREDVERLHSEIKRVVRITEELHRYAVSLQEKRWRAGGSGSGRGAVTGQHCAAERQ